MADVTRPIPAAGNIPVSLIAKPFVAELTASLPILLNGNTQFDGAFTGGNGTSMNVIIPDFGVGSAPTTGPGIATDAELAYNAATISVALTQRKVAVALDSIDQGLRLGNLEDQVAKPKAAYLASFIQKAAADELLASAGSAIVINSGTAGYAEIGNAVGSIKQARSLGDICGALSNDLASQIKNSGLSYFNDNSALSRTFVKGALGEYRGAMWAETPDVSTFVQTTFAATNPTVTSLINTNGATAIACTCTGGSGSIAAGTVVTLAGVKAVDIYGNAVNADASFVTTSATAVGATSFTLNVQPIYFTGVLKNVSTASLAATTPVTIQNQSGATYLRGLVWDKQAFIFASAKLKPLSMSKSVYADTSKLSVLQTITSDGISFVDIMRWDVLTGFKSVRPQWVRRIDVKV